MINIRSITAVQSGSFNPAINRWEGVNQFKEYALFCQQRRKHHRGRKGITRMGRDLRRPKQ